MKPREYFGEWWLPSNPENKIKGTLTVPNQKSIHLKLDGVFEKTTEIQTKDDFISVGSVLGKTDKNEIITLFAWICYTVKSSDLIHQEGTVGHAYIGAHFHKAEDFFSFSKVKAKYTHLADWANIGGLKLQSPQQQGDGFRIAYTKTNLKKIEIEKHNLWLEHIPSIKLKPKLIDPNKFAPETKRIQIEEFSEATFREEVAIFIEAQEGKFADDWLSGFIIPFQDFLTFATAQPNYPTEIILYTPEKEVECISSTLSSRITETIPSDHSTPKGMFFTLSEIADFEKVVGRWFKLSRDLGVVRSLLLEEYYNPQISRKHKFLNAIQALELYHRERFFDRSQAFPKEEHEDLKNTLLAAIAKKPEKWSAWLRDRLRNEISLRERIKGLIDDYTWPVISPLLPDKDKFISKVIATRNFLTHRDKEIENKSAQDSELDGIADILLYILGAWFLKEMDFSAERTVELFQRSAKYITTTVKLEFEPWLQRLPSID